MKHKAFCLLLCISLIYCILPSAMAAESLPRIVDTADLLVSSKEMDIKEEVEAICQQHGIELVILTVKSLDGAPASDVAKDYYDQNGYGDDGLLYLLSMEEREWYISTCGSMSYALPDYDVQLLGESILPFLSEGDYDGAFDALLAYLPAYLDAYPEQQPFDGYVDSYHEYYYGDQNALIYQEERSTASILLISFGAGILTATVIVFLMYSSMNTKKKQSSASGYVAPGSYHLTGHQDLFLYSNVSKVRRQQNSSGGSGGSSVHRSSGGRRHGGGGGKF